MGLLVAAEGCRKIDHATLLTVARDGFVWMVDGFLPREKDLRSCVPFCWESGFCYRCW